MTFPFRGFLAPEKPKTKPAPNRRPRRSRGARPKDTRPIRRKTGRNVPRTRYPQNRRPRVVPNKPKKGYLRLFRRGAGAIGMMLAPDYTSTQDSFDAHPQDLLHPESKPLSIPPGDYLAPVLSRTNIDKVGEVIPASPQHLEELVPIPGGALQRRTRVKTRNGRKTVQHDIEMIPTEIPSRPSAAPARSPSPVARPTTGHPGSFKIDHASLLHPAEPIEGIATIPRFTISITNTGLRLKAAQTARVKQNERPKKKDDKKAHQRAYRAALGIINATWGTYTELLDLWDAFTANLYTKPLHKIPPGHEWKYLAKKQWHENQEGNWEAKYEYWNFNDNMQMLSDAAAGKLHLDVQGFLQDFALNQAQDIAHAKLGRYQKTHGASNRATDAMRFANVLPPI